MKTVLASILAVICTTLLFNSALNKADAHEYQAALNKHIECVESGKLTCPNKPNPSDYGIK